ncbi:MAG: hypothetical protein M1820_000993 [Bogoriella megaspora]|nr:MAG: hypothetical protein M1820_000993 [Bogoriella megaspora]
MPPSTIAKAAQSESASPGFTEPAKPKRTRRRPRKLPPREPSAGDGSPSNGGVRLPPIKPAPKPIANTQKAAGGATTYKTAQAAPRTTSQAAPKRDISVSNPNNQPKNNGAINEEIQTLKQRLREVEGQLESVLQQLGTKAPKVPRRRGRPRKLDKDPDRAEELQSVKHDLAAAEKDLVAVRSSSVAGSSRSPSVTTIRRDPLEEQRSVIQRSKSSAPRMEHDQWEELFGSFMSGSGLLDESMVTPVQSYFPAMPINMPSRLRMPSGPGLMRMGSSQTFSTTKQVGPEPGQSPSDSPRGFVSANYSVRSYSEFRAL